MNCVFAGIKRSSCRVGLVYKAVRVISVLKMRYNDFCSVLWRKARMLFLET